jgi:hypothetical protein
MTIKSKNLKWEVNKGYHPTQDSVVPYAEKIVQYGDKNYVIHENMIFKGGTIADSSYSVYEFDQEGEYMGAVRVQDLPDGFFYEMDIVAEI